MKSNLFHPLRAVNVIETVAQCSWNLLSLEYHAQSNRSNVFWTFSNTQSARTASDQYYYQEICEPMFQVHVYSSQSPNTIPSLLTLDHVEAFIQTFFYVLICGSRSSVMVRNVVATA